MRHISLFSRTLKISFAILLMLLAAKATADAGNHASHLSYKLNNSAVLPEVTSQNLQDFASRTLLLPDSADGITLAAEPSKTQLATEVFTDTFSQLATKDEFNLMSENFPEAPTETASSHIVKLPIPATVVLFAGAFTWLMGISRRSNKLLAAFPSECIDVLGIKFLELNYERVINLFQTWIIAKEAHQVSCVNVHTLVSSLSDKNLRSIYNSSLNINTMDGVPVVWYAKLIQGKLQASKVCGPDLMLKCLDVGRSREWKHYFLGGTEQVLQDLVKTIQQRFPGVDIVGWHSPAFRQLSAEEDAALVQMINEAKPDFLWVGLGAPKQEVWIASHLDRVNAPVQLGVGAAFNFHSGHIKRAPKWMQKSGLEWVYRVYKEKRLLKRYLSTNPVFLFLLLRDFIFIRLLKLKAFNYQ